MANPKAPKKAVAYLRASATSPIRRQRDRIRRYARLAGYQIVAEFVDIVGLEADPIFGRPGFEALLNEVESRRRLKVVLVRDAVHFGQQLLPRLIGVTVLAGRGVRVFAADGENLSLTHIPGSKLIRPVGDASADFEKRWLTKKIQRIRDARQNAGLRFSGRKKRIEFLTPGKASRLTAAVKLAKSLRRSRPSIAKPVSYREIAKRLKEAGYLNERGEIYNPASIKRMLDGQLRIRSAQSQLGRARKSKVKLCREVE